MTDPLSALGGPGVLIEIGPFVVRVRTEVPSLRRHLERLYPDFPAGIGDSGHFDVAVLAGRGIRRWVRRQSRLVLNGAEPFLPLAEDMAGPSMEWGLNWCIGQRAHRWVPVHAAAVERQGRAMILSAPSGSGKSTLCAAMVFSGWRLFSDEFALIDPATRRLSPAPRPLCLKEAAIDIMRRRYPDVVLSDIRLDVEKHRFVHARPPADSVRRAGETAPVGWIVLPRYVPGQPTLIEPLPKAQALMALTDQSFNYNYLGARGYECLVDLVREAECYRLEYSDLDDVLARLAQLSTR